MVSKLLDEQSDRNDSIFVHEGKFYKPATYNIEQIPGSPDRMDVTFTRINIDFGKEKTDGDSV